MKLVDSHCHLNYDFAPKSLEDILQEARDAGVESFITIGTEMETIPLLEKISSTYEGIYHTVGVHPHDTGAMKDSDLETLERAARHPRCRAIGEIGLDYHYDHSVREVQKQRLEEQLDLAVRTQQPIVIHSREGEDDLLMALERYVAKLPDGVIPGVIHCFSGTEEFGKKCIDMGFYISFSGIITFKKADDIRSAAKAFPLDRLLVETDSPYLAPIPFRGKKCEPSMVKLTAEKLAEVKGVSFQELAEITTQNANRVFRIGPTENRANR